MSLSVSDVKFRKSVRQTDTSSNGGRKGQALVVSGARHNLFPRVTKAERTNGLTRYRKEFWCNENADDLSAYGALVFFEWPSLGGDHFLMAKGTQTDTQGDIDNSYVFTGIGQLSTSLSGGEMQVELDTEDGDPEFYNGDYLHLSDKFSTGQTIASDVAIGDSVEEISGTWEKISPQTDIVYPYGMYLGSNVVLTYKDSTNEEWIQIAIGETADEVIGSGDGSNQTPTLSALTTTRGIQGKGSYAATFKATCGGQERTVTVGPDGVCSGYCSAGELNLSDGTWASSITWSTAPDNGTNITATYYEVPYSYSGNTATVHLENAVANSFGTANTYGAGCIYVGEVKTSFESWSENSSSGTYDENNYPPVLFNDGAERDTFTLQFTSATNFDCTGSNLGSLGSGSISADFSPSNPYTGEPLFTIRSAGWGGTWASGDTVSFTTNPSAIPIWLKEVVPSGTSEEANNLAVLGWYAE